MTGTVHDRLDISDRCECDWRFHQGQPCPTPAADHDGLFVTPQLCIRCLYVCEGEREDEMENSR